MTIHKTTKRLKILHFDTESRPLSWISSDYVTSELTAIAAGWADDEKIFSWVLGLHSPFHMHSMFEYLWMKADIVTGHYIRKHDLPRINSDRFELGLKPLSPRFVQDTCSDLHKFQGNSKSQENLCEMFGLEEEKYHMNQIKWRKANRLEREGLRLTRERVEGDVAQHKALRGELLRRGMLKPPKLWKS